LRSIIAVLSISLVISVILLSQCHRSWGCSHSS